MDGGDGGLRFDFEDYLDAVGAGSGSASSEAPILAVGGPSRGRGRGSFQMDGDEDSLRFGFEDDLDAAGAGTGSSAGYFEALIPAAGGPSHCPGSGSIQMDGDEGNLRFDFEDYLDAVGAGSGSASASSEAPMPVTEGLSHGRRCGIFRQTVCHHWLRGLCKKGESCSFLHQLDMELMQVCLNRAFRFCRAEDCNFKHEIQECEMFSVGFCPNGPNCKYMHVKLPGPPPPVQEVFQKFQQTNAYNYGSSSRTYEPRDYNCKQKAKPQVQHGSVLKNQNAQVQGVHNGSSIQKLPQPQAHFHKGNQGTRSGCSSVCAFGASVGGLGNRSGCFPRKRFSLRQFAATKLKSWILFQAALTAGEAQGDDDVADNEGKGIMLFVSTREAKRMIRTVADLLKEAVRDGFFLR